jgi:multisubunit Na+/H+ antiporter MnhB subunit
MIETIVAGLILALVSGITILAFKYKKVFDKVFEKFLIIIGCIFIVLFIWNIAIEYSFSEIYKYIENGKTELAKESLPYFPLRTTYLGIIFIVIQIYLSGLKYLTNLIKEDDEK